VTKRNSIFPVFIGREHRNYSPTFFKPRSRKPEKILSEFLTEARRLIQEVQKIRARHKDQIEAANILPKFEDDGFIFHVFGRMLADGEPDQFSYEYHEFQREFALMQEEKRPFNPFDLFLRLSKLAGGSPLWHAIWHASSSLESIYTRPASIMDEPSFEPFFLYDAMISVSALAFYVEVAERYGDDMLLAIIDGAEIEVGYSLPSDRN
jgi:hypothetical protein